MKCRMWRERIIDALVILMALPLVVIFGRGGVGGSEHAGPPPPPPPDRG